MPGDPRIYSGTEHRVPMFAKNPELEPMVVDWLKTQLYRFAASAR